MSHVTLFQMGHKVPVKNYGRFLLEIYNIVSTNSVWKTAEWP